MTDLLDLTVGGPLDQPFFTGSAPETAEDSACPVSLDGRGFIVDDGKRPGYYRAMQRAGVDLTNTQQSNSAGDSAQVPPEVWRRSIETWDGGAGQGRADRDTSDPSRFDDSYRVNVWDPWRATLLHDCVSLLDGVTSGRVWLETVNDTYLVVVKGTDLWWFTALNLPPTHVTVASPAVGVTCDGQFLYVLGTDGKVEKWTNSGTHSTYVTVGSFVPTRAFIAFVNGFLVVGNGNQLLNVTGGAATTIYTHPLANFGWVAACSGGRCAYLLGGMGDHWMVQKMAPNTVGTTFDPPSQAAPLPDGEVGYAIASYLGYVLVGLDSGWRFAELTDADGNLSFGRLVTSDAPVRCFEGQDHFVWFGRDGVLDRAAALGRADLSAFTNPLTPAWAPDLTTPVGLGAIWAVTTFKNHRVFASEADDVYAETDDLAPTGWLKQGALGFATTDDKMGLYVQAFHDQSGGSYTIDASFDGSVYEPLGGASTSTTTGRLQIARGFQNLSLRYNLVRSGTAPNLGPIITRVEVRAIPVSGKATQFRIPLIVRERFEVNGIVIERDAGDDNDWLLGLYQSRRPFPLRVLQRWYQVYATDFLQLPEEPNPTETDYVGMFIMVMKEVA